MNRRFNGTFVEQFWVHVYLDLEVCMGRAGFELGPDKILGLLSRRGPSLARNIGLRICPNPARNKIVKP